MANRRANPPSSMGEECPTVQVGGLDLQRMMSHWDTKLNAYPVVAQASHTVGIRPSILFACFSVFLLFSLGFGWGGGIVCDLTGFLYPAWQSFKAVETPGRDDDKLWLTYWVVYAAFSLLEYFVDIILFWVPFYYLLKCAFLLYLYLPWTKGAETIYNQVIRPHLLEHEKSIDGAVEQITQVGASAAEGLQQALNDGATLVNQAAGLVRQRKPGVAH
ncbi:Receptor expression-enhancing protein 3, related [Neospora caninum Liverpool]|uniref:Receptor expression-enhancing protein 3, related n=1 Tax=Neospora caninum (strain Liverpool) TaxID=572307 RepID=F0VHL0_NEOCL|nr:Receptor expression-enhancing protein 3, related [Neospora caninum Liverpool]CBZ53204.1 Receptor expression-enhancing protein 3, related [Neospora caninum Liverpool]CEL67194.1 TPA: Receptor expression-enhancing protein 3, related [Neospora caninum Liverpool]|eukprot:XP_003883236.1 Receptor expression-enhancing protein 3, related [Neospora caninum Liverpool]